MRLGSSQRGLSFREELRRAIQKGSGTSVVAPNITTRQRLLATLVPTLPDSVPATGQNRLNSDDGTWLFMVNKDACDDVGPIIG